jgi:spore maturation protein CgeB
MRVVMFYHSLISDWNHGNAHFLRGIVSDLMARGHSVTVYEPENAWSLENLLAEHGGKPIRKFRATYPGLKSVQYRLDSINLDEILNPAELVIVHEWSDHRLVERIGEHHSTTGHYRLLFHDTHHRMVTDPESMGAYRLEHYDGVLAYGKVLRDLYLASGRVRRAWVWHEAADTRVFRPPNHLPHEGDLVWIGNWGDDERSAELHEYLIEPAQELGLKSAVYGVRYPQTAKAALAEAGIEYRGWLPNFDAPRIFGQFHMTVHIPRRPYVKALAGIPTIRVFEALACGIPLICSPWNDVEGLFRAGRDYLVARTGSEMKKQMRDLREDAGLRTSLAASGLETIQARHTCAHRVDELLKIIGTLDENL